MVAAPSKIVRREIESLDLVRLRDVLEELAVAGNKDPLLDTVLALLTKCKGVIEEQAFEIAALERQLFGRKSEKCSPDQLSLFAQFLGALVAQSPQTASTTEEVAPTISDEVGDALSEARSEPQHPSDSDTPKRKRRKLQPSTQQVIPVPDDERPCPTCGGDRRCMGHARSLMIEYTPPKLEVIELLREKLACRRCDGEITLASTPAIKLERSRPGPRLLATLAVNKTVDGLPLNRTRQILGRLGVHLPIQTLNRWEDRGYELLQPIAQRIAALVKDADLINLDDTGLRARSRKIRGDTVHGHIWTFVGRTFDPGGDLAKTLVFASYLFAPTWEAKYPDDFLAESKAILQGDAYAGYGLIARVKAQEPKNVLVGCAMHARRGFFEAMRAGDPGAFFFVERFQRLYEIEALAKKECLTADARLQLRQSQSVPLLNELKAQLDRVRGLPLIKPMRDAVGYMRKQWERLVYPFECDGRLEIDNGEAERRLRRLASGRKAWMFAGSERAAARFAGMLSIVVTAEANDVEPGAYLVDLFAKLSAGWPARRLDDLLPHRWKLLQERGE